MSGVCQMKFGKQLARVIDSSDPEWAPYWVNYKLLKKKLKELPRCSFPSKNNMACHVAHPVRRGAGGGQAVAGSTIVEERQEGGGGKAEAVEAEKPESCCGAVACPNAVEQASVAVGGGQATFNANEQIAALSR